VRRCYWFLSGRCDKAALSASLFCCAHAHAAPGGASALAALNPAIGSKIWYGKPVIPCHQEQAATPPKRPYPIPPTSPRPPALQGNSKKSGAMKRAKLTNRTTRRT
jgi:hypothetical protein